MGGELFLFCLSVGMLALVGHGIWLLGAAIIRALFGPDPPSDRKPAPAPGPRAHCPRCESDHRQFPIKKLAKPTFDGFTHWGICPTTGDPVLFNFKSGTKGQH